MESGENVSEVLEGQWESGDGVQVPEVTGEGCGLVRHAFRRVQARENVRETIMFGAHVSRVTVRCSRRFTLVGKVGIYRAC